MTSAKEYGQKIRKLNVRNLYDRFTSDSVERTIKIQDRFSGNAGGQMGEWWHRTSRRLQKGKYESLIKGFKCI
jgi:hypothetical protein